MYLHNFFRYMKNILPVFLSAFLLFVSQVAATPSSNESMIDSDSNELFFESIITREANLLFGKGPFEVSGEPSSFAVAWVDHGGSKTAKSINDHLATGGDDRYFDNNLHQKFVLNLAIFEGSQIPFIKQISADVHPEEKIFLEKDQEKITMSWKEGDGWHLTLLERTDKTQGSTDGYYYDEKTFLLATYGLPLSISLQERKLAILMVPGEKEKRELQENRVQQKVNSTGEGNPSFLILPGFDHPTLFEIDFSNLETRAIYMFSQAISSASLSYRRESWTLMATESLSRNLQYLEISSLGDILDYRLLNNFPVKDISTILKEVRENSFAGWIEGRPTKDMAILGLLTRGDSGNLYLTKEISSPLHNVAEILLSEGRGIWTIWSEEIQEKNQLRMMALDLEGNPVCLFETDLDASIRKFWVLEEEQRAFLFKLKKFLSGEKSSEEKSVLTIQEIRCDELGNKLQGALRKEEIVSLENGFQDFSNDRTSGEGTLLGAAEEPCDGYDNDGDGGVDEGCDLICDNPEKRGSDMRLTNNSSASEHSSLVWTGSEYGVAWRDYRNGNYEIYFGRFDSSGNRIGSDVRVTSNSASSNWPSVTWTGSEYGIAWHDDRNGNLEIYFARLNSSGTKIGSDVRITSDSASSSDPWIVWTGSEYGVCWRDNRLGNWNIYFARISSTGTKIGSDKKITSDGYYFSDPTMVWNGSGYGVALISNENGTWDIRLNRLDNLGNKLTETDVTYDATSDSWYPALTWNGSGYGLAWRDNRNGNDEIYFARLNSSGTKIGSDVRVTYDSSGSYYPSITSTSSEYAVSWRDYRNGNYEIYLARLNSSGSKVGSDLRVTNNSSDSAFPFLVWNGSEYGLSWNDYRNGNHEIYFAPVRCCDDRDGDGYTECAGDSNDEDPAIYPGAVEVCDGIDNDSDGIIDDGCDSICDNSQKRGSDARIVNDAGDSHWPALAWTGSEYGVCWQDYRNGNWEIYFARFDTSGSKIGSDVRVTSNSSGSLDPHIAWTGSEYGIVWRDNRDGNWEIYFAHLNSSGTKLDSDIRVTADSSYSSEPEIVWTGNEYGISWNDIRNGPWEIYFTRLDASADKIGNDIRVTESNSDSWYPSITWTGDEYGIAWRDNRDGNDEIYLARLDPQGNQIGSDSRVTYNSSGSYLPVLTWAGSQYGLSWRDYRDGNYEIYFARLNSSGTKIGSDVRVTSHSSNSSNEDLFWTGEEFGLTWQDDRNGNSEIYMARLSSAGIKISSDLRVTYNASSSEAPSLVWSGDEYGISWRDFRDGAYEIYFAPIRCCDDEDGDGYTDCSGDTNDADPNINPGAVEICDGKDNDSDGIIDDGCDPICDDPEKRGSDVRITNYTSSSSRPSLAWTGSEYGVSWHDYRDGNEEIYFARFDSSGNKIGSEVRLTYYSSHSWDPSLVWTGNEYGVSWRDERDGVGEIYFARLNSSGSKIGSDIRVTYNSGYSSIPSLVWNGSEYGIAWPDQRTGNNEIYFVRLDSSGNKIGMDQRITNDASNSIWPCLVWTGSEYAVAWYDYRDGNYEIYFARMDSLGNKIGSDVRITYNASWSESRARSLVWTGSQFGISWIDDRDGNEEIYFARLNYSGSKIGSDVRVTTDAAISEWSSLVWTGSEFGISWHDFRDEWEIYLARLDSSGNKIGSDLRLTYSSGWSEDSSLVWTGIEYGVSWADHRLGDSEIYFAPVRCCDDEDSDGYSECAGDTNDADPSVNPGVDESCDGKDNDSDGSIDEVCDGICDNAEKFGSDNRVTNNSYSSNLPTLAWTGSEYGTFWEDYRDGNSEIYFARLSSLGSKIGSDLRLTNNSLNSLRPYAVWTGSEYGMTWQDNRDGNDEIYFARVDSSGSKIGSDVRASYGSYASQYPSLVWTGSEYGIVWDDYRDGNYEIYLARLDFSGTRIGAEIRVTEQASGSYRPSLVWTGSEYGVSWYDQRDGNYEIYFARLDSAGNKIGSDIRVTSNASSSYSYRGSLVWAGSEFGISWYDQRDGNAEIYFARLNSAGTKIGSDVRVTNNASTSNVPSLIWSGSEYGISWYDNRDGNYEAYFVRLNSSGSKIGSDMRVTNNASSSYYPFLAWSGSDYAISWYDLRDGNNEIYFVPIRCCDDVDGDGYSECAGDTNDSDPAINPGAAETCDGEDNNGDGSLDEACDSLCDNPEKWESDVRITSANESSNYSSLIWTGNEYSVSWHDFRNLNGEIYFARLDPSGNQIGTDVRVTNNSSSSSFPSLTWTGSEFGVSWYDFRDGNYEIYFARLDSSGSKIGSDRRVTYHSGDSKEPSLVWKGNEYGLSWKDHRDGNDEIYFARIDSSGNKIGSDVRVTFNSNQSGGPDLVWTGNEFGISWWDDRDGNDEIYFARLDSSGNKIGSDIRVTYALGYSLSNSLVWSGSEYGISWYDNRYGNSEILFARLDSSGSKIGSDVRVTNNDLNSIGPSLTWTGNEYGISWHDDRDGNYEIYLTRLDSSGSKIGSDTRLTEDTATSNFTSLIWNGTNYGTTWTDQRDANEEIYFASIRCCDDVDSDGYSECAGDTNDADPAINPGLVESCDSKDNDSDGSIDEGCDSLCDDSEKNGSEIRITSNSADSLYASLAWTGIEYGVSWRDTRDGNDEIYFTRMDSSGNKIGPDIRVTYYSDNSLEPSLIWSGSEYGVSWYDYRDGNAEIYFTRLDSTGSKIGSDLRVTFNDSFSVSPSMAWTGSEYGISWHDERDVYLDYEIYFARLDSSGNKIGSDIRVTYQPGDSYDSSLAWTGSEFGISWYDYRDGNSEIYLARLDSSGTKIGSDTRVTTNSSSSEYPSLVWAGSGYGVSWYDYRDGNWEIYMARLDSSGVKIGSDLRVTNDPSNSYYPSLVWSGGEYGLSWYDVSAGNSEIYFARVDSSGSKIGSDVRLTYDDLGSSGPSLVWMGSEYAVSWLDSRDGNREIYFVPIRCCDDLDSDGYSECAGDPNDTDPLINPDAAEICDGQDNDGDNSTDEGCDSVCDNSEKAGSDVKVTDTVVDSLNADLAWAGNEYAVSWNDYRDGNGEIYFARIDSSGNKVGSDMRVSHYLNSSFNPSLAWTGNGFGVSWHDERHWGDTMNSEVYFARLDSSGNKIGSDVRVTNASYASNASSLVWAGNEYGLAWQDKRDGNFEIYFARLDTSGNKIGSSIRVTNDSNYSYYPSLVWTGSVYSISWKDGRDGNSEIYFARLNSTGEKIDPPGDMRVTTDSSYSENPSLVWTGSEYGVSWEDYRDDNDGDGTDEGEIYFARLDFSGNKISPPGDRRVTYNSAASQYPSLVWTGDEYGISWEDYRNGTYQEIYFTRLNSSGTKIGSDMRITTSLSSRDSSLVWTGSDYGVSWEDFRESDLEIFFTPIQCCDDVDSDGYSECAGDTNDADSGINPGRAETCDGMDNDSDGTLDEVCDTSCDDPQKWGTDERISFNDQGSELPSLTWTDDEFAVAWEDNRPGIDQIYFARIDANGDLIGSEMRIVYTSADARAPSLTWIGSEYGLAWRDYRDGNWEIYFTRLNLGGGKIGSDIRVTTNASTALPPHLVWNGSEYGVSWEDDRDGNYEIYFARLDKVGNKIGPDVRVSYGSGNSWNKHMVWTGSEYGLTWRDDRDGNWEIYFARVDSKGNVIGSDTRMTNDVANSYRPRLAWAGNGYTEYGLTWYDGRDGNNEAYFMRVDSTGSKIGSDTRISFHGSISSTPDIAWSGEEYGISWLENRDGNFEIYFVRVDSAGNKIGSDVRITYATGASEYPYIVWTGNGYGVSWEDKRDGADYEIYFTWVKCCSNDVDGDLSGACDDCDDYDSDNYPGNTETCDYQDNDCDSIVDEGFPTPGGTSGLTFTNDKQTMDWTSVINAAGYDTVKGDLQTLISSGGNFTSSVTDCLENDDTDTQASDTAEPTSAGEGFFYLVRAQNDCKYGTYDTGQPSQVGGRDSEIDSSSNKCP